MDKKEFKKRGKGLLALLLAMIMMFGSSMTVLAATIDLNAVNGNELTVNQILHGGDTISCYQEGSGGSLTVTIDGNIISEGITRSYYNDSSPVYCTIKIPKVAKGNTKSCMRIFSIIEDAFGICKLLTKKN